ncbi:MAG: hypothetical protein COA79_11785 [Planctomycetota bacterium]|nr:MAG: hypothetical protein COA79_11785 [Planctomycetota bacterium]
MSFNITQLEENNILTINVTGDLDNETYQGLEHVIKENLADKHFRVLIDFSGVHGFCSAAEFVLIWANKEICNAGGKLVLCCGSPSVYELMVAFGLNTHLPIFSNLEEALQSFK